MRWLAALALLVLAGCTAPAGGDDDPTATRSATTSATTSASDAPACHPSFYTCDCPPDSRPSSLGCLPTPHVSLAVEASAAVILDVPFPHGDHCLSQDDWMGGRHSLVNATVAAATVDRDGIAGQVLRITFTAAGQAGLHVNVTGRATCQTFRYDPWSVDPDPSAGNLTVLADRAAVPVLVRPSHGDACTTFEEFKGNTTAPSWTRLVSRPPLTYCI